MGVSFDQLVLRDFIGIFYSQTESPNFVYDSHSHI